MSETLATAPAKGGAELRRQNWGGVKPHVKRLLDEINARPAAARAEALRRRHAFKAEMDEEAQRNWFPQNERLRAAMGSAVLLVVVALTWLLRTARPVIHLPNDEELQQAKGILMASDQPDGGLALTGDKALLFHPNHKAFLMYARRGRSLVALYDPIGPAQERAEMIWQFRDLCDLHHARPVFYQVRAENLPFYMDIGLTALKLGEEARVDLRRFDLEAKGKFTVSEHVVKGEKPLFEKLPDKKSA